MQAGSLSVHSGGRGTVGPGDIGFSSSSKLVSTWCAAKKELSRLDQLCKTGNLICPFPVLQPEGQALIKDAEVSVTL